MRYLKLIIVFIKNNLSREMEYRANFFFWIIVEISWVLVQIALISIIFSVSDTIRGWTKYQLFLLIGIFRCIDGLFHIFFHTNLLSFPENIRTGSFDLFLTKPLDPQFFMTTRFHSLDEIATFFTGVFIIFYSLNNLHIHVSVFLILSLIIYVLLGLVSLYSIILIMSSLAFFLTRLTALESVWDVLSKTLRIPIDLIAKENHLLNILFLPLFIVVTVPAQIITQKISLLYLPEIVIGSVLLFLFSRKFFLFSLRRYSSASS